MKNVFRTAILGSLLTAVAPLLHAQTPPPAFAATGLAVGETAPPFRAKAAAGREVNLQQLLKKGPVPPCCSCLPLTLWAKTVK